MDSTNNSSQKAFVGCCEIMKNSILIPINTFYCKKIILLLGTAIRSNREGFDRSWNNFTKHAMSETGFDVFTYAKYAIYENRRPSENLTVAGKSRPAWSWFYLFFLFFYF